MRQVAAEQCTDLIIATSKQCEVQQQEQEGGKDRDRTNKLNRSFITEQMIRDNGTMRRNVGSAGEKRNRDCVEMESGNGK